MQDLLAFTRNVIREENKPKFFIGIHLHDGAEAQTATFMLNHRSPLVIINLPSNSLPADGLWIARLAFDVSFVRHRSNRFPGKNPSTIKFTSI